MNTKLLLSTLALGAALSTGAVVLADGAPGTPVPTQVVYLPALPTVSAFTARAAADGVSVVRADQIDGRLLITYKYANGATTTVAYEVMPAGAAATAAAPVPAAQPATVAVPTTAPTVVYETAPVYTSYTYDPYWYPPVAVGLGFGWGWGGWGWGHGGWGHGGGWGGGFRR